MPDPLSLVDMAPAVERLAKAVQSGETIGIFGDYDVDGATSSALLADFFKACGTPFIIHIPDRIFEGYGPNVEAIAALAASGVTCLVTVDCGTMSHGPLAEAKGLGLDAIVIDHHQAPEQLPDAIVVNPNRLDDLSGLGQLCAAGVAFMLLVALKRVLRDRGFWTRTRLEPDLLMGLDLVALATVADVAPLTGLNRAFVTKGLAVMRARGRAGLRALFDCAGMDGPPRPYHLGFVIGPRINAGGRIGDAALGAKLLTLTDEAEARRIAEELDRLNRERQVLEAATLEAAEAEALGLLGLEEKGAAIVTASAGWHPGIVGLVASRLKEKYRRPAFAIAFDGETGTGSGRSIAGIDLGRVVRAAVEAGVLVKGGGHAMAAGLTITQDRLADFRTFLEFTPRRGCGQCAGRGSAFRRCDFDRRRRRTHAARIAGARRTLWPGQSGAGFRFSGTSADRCRAGRQWPHQAQGAGGRRRENRWNCLQNRSGTPRNGPGSRKRAGGASRRHIVARPLGRP